MFRALFNLLFNLGLTFGEKMRADHRAPAVCVGVVLAVGGPEALPKRQGSSAARRDQRPGCLLSGLETDRDSASDAG